MNTQTMFENSEMALAAYASLNSSALSAQKASLKEAGLSDVQADTFASRYAVLTQYNDTIAEGGLGTSFSATVFVDISGNLSLAIRGTLEVGDYVPTDSSIATAGAGYDQIVAMWNWWQRASNTASTSVTQYRLVATPIDLGHATWIAGAGLWLESYEGTANGTMVNALAADDPQKFDITGHSLGGHLAMAFGAIFPSVTNEITVFNAPGFKATSDNQLFFAMLGGAVPSGVHTTNVIADEANVGAVPWSAIAGLNSRPGIAIDIPIENQAVGDEPLANRPAALNHSQQTLTDALAVYAALAKLDTSLSSDTFKVILNAAAAGTSASLERIVDVLESTFGVNADMLTSGNADRDLLYQAIYGLQANASYQSMQGRTIITSLVDKGTAALAGLAKNGDIDALAYRYALKELNPFAVLGDNSLYTKFNKNGELDLIDPATGTGSLSAEWLQDRAEMLAWKLKLATEDFITTNGAYTDAPNQFFADLSSGLQLNLGSDWTNPADKPRFIFGSDQAEGVTEVLSGGSQGDHLYGGGGTDVLYGYDGNDRLEGGDGQDTLIGGGSSDLLHPCPLAARRRAGGRQDREPRRRHGGQRGNQDRQAAGDRVLPESVVAVRQREFAGAVREIGQVNREATNMRDMSELESRCWRDGDSIYAANDAITRRAA